MQVSFNLICIDIELAEGDDWLQGDEEVELRKFQYVAGLSEARTEVIRPRSAGSPIIFRCWDFLVWKG